jgi:hypothetical protein
MSAPEPLRGCAKSAAPKTGTAKAAEVTSAKVAATKAAATTEVPTTTAAGPCRLTKRNKSGDYKAK